jgi:hypothetical protein
LGHLPAWRLPALIQGDLQGSDNRPEMLRLVPVPFLDLGRAKLNREILDDRVQILARPISHDGLTVWR